LGEEIILRYSLARAPGLVLVFATSDADFRGDDESLNYSTARYLCQWMDGRKKLWPFYHAWRDGFAADPTGERAVVATMGFAILFCAGYDLEQELGDRGGQSGALPSPSTRP
jgi:hypothetical protein